MKTTLLRKDRGFSMAELMVSVVIIAILSGIMFAALARAKTNAIYTKTAPAMTAALNGFHDYATEHNGYFPPAYFPKGGESDGATGDNLTGQARWLDQTIFGQVYPNANAAIDDTDEQGKDAGDNTVGVEDGGAFGHHLIKTIFEVPASVVYDPNEQNWYNHSYCINRALITDQVRRKQPKPEFSPRNRNLFADDAATMLIVEGSEGDNNSIAPENYGQILDAAKRYEDKYVHAGFMDGHVERIKLDRFPKNAGGTDDASYFWRGVSMQSYSAYSRDNPKINY